MLTNQCECIAQLCVISYAIEILGIRLNELRLSRSDVLSQNNPELNTKKENCLNCGF